MLAHHFASHCPDLPRNRVEDKHCTSIDHVPFVPSQVVKDVGQDAVVRYAEALKHGSLPEATTSQEGCRCIYDAKRKNALYRTGDHAEGECLRVIFVPSLYIEGERCYVW